MVSDGLSFSEQAHALVVDNTLDNISADLGLAAAMRLKYSDAAGSKSPSAGSEPEMATFLTLAEECRSILRSELERAGRREHARRLTAVFHCPWLPHGVVVVTATTGRTGPPHFGSVREGQIDSQR